MPSSQVAGRPKNVRPAIVPVIPLPLVQKQQQQRQQKQQQLELEKQQQEEKERRERQEKEKAEREKREKLQKERLEKEKDEAASQKNKDALASDEDHKKSVVEPAFPPTSADNTSSLSSATTPQTAHETTTDVSSPVAKTPQSSTNTPSADPTAAPFVPPPVIDGYTPPPLVGQPQPHIPAGPASAGLPSNGHVMPEFVFPPHSRSGSAARHRGPPRHVVNPQLQQHPLHTQHHPHPGFHQAHPSASSITFGTFHDSNSASPVPTGHGPLPPPPPPPPGLIGGPQFIPYNVPNMGGPGEWQQGVPGAPHVGDVSVNGFAPSSAGLNSSTPGSFHGSHSPDNVADGAGFQHQGGPYPVPGGPNGHLSLRNNDSMSSMMSPPFFPPNGFPNAGPHDRHHGSRNGIPARGIDFQFVQHLQHLVQHSFENPQTTDCHLIFHLPHYKTTAASQSSAPEQQQQSVSTTVFAGHCSVLVQSYSIGNLVRSDTGIMHSGPFNQPILALHMKIDDPYITIEAAVQALRSLYGHPLADPTADRSLSPTQALDKALANLAAGFFFMLDHVESVAAEQAERLLGWDTVEKVLAFCLNGATFPNTAGIDEDVYGPAFAPARLRYARGAGIAVRRLLNRAIAFIAHQVPADFCFDASEPKSSASTPVLLRFPVDTWSAYAGPAQDSSNGAARARSAGSVSLPTRKTSDATSAKQASVRSPKILFGDFAPRVDESARYAQGINGVMNGMSAHYQADEAGPDISAVLSRILLNLPFNFLKHVLDQPQLAGHRASFARAIIDERERRRLRTLDGLHAGTIMSEPEQRDAILGRNQQPTPPAQSNPPFTIEEWDVLGWAEVCDGNTGHLERYWAVNTNASR